MTTAAMTTALPIFRVLSLVAAMAALQGCSAGERLSRVGKAPDMSPVSDPTSGPSWRPVTMPMHQEGPSNVEANSLWRAGSRTFLRDQRAAQVGDIITVLVSIQDTAELQNRTQRSRNGSESMGLPSVLGFQTRLGGGLLPRAFDPANAIEASGTSSTEGAGQVRRNEQITLRVAGTVVQVLPNGNMVVRARQEVRVNHELRELAVAGVVRPQDIASDNTIRHDRLAEARISYGGRGTVSDVQQPRYGQQLLDIVLPF